MKKLLIILSLLTLVFSGCMNSATTDKKNIDTVSNPNDKFFPEGLYFTVELFYEYASIDENILNPDETGQTYIFDLRNEEEYDKGHIYGAINMSVEECEKVQKDLFTDLHVFFIGGDEAKMLAEKYRITHNASYAIEGGYDALLKTEGIEKYITTEKFNLTHLRIVDDNMEGKIPYNTVFSC